MATQEDLLLIQQIRDVANSLRGASQALGQGQQNVINLQAQQQQGEIARQRQLTDIGSQRGFVTQEREAAQEFRQELQTEQIAGQKDIAQLRGPETKINIQLRDQTKVESQQQFQQDLVTSGVMEPVDPKDPKAGFTVDASALGRASVQGDTLRNRIISLQGTSEEDFQTSKDTLNTNAQSLIAETNRAGVKSIVPGFLVIKPGETKEKYLSRLKALRENLINREFQRRLKEAKKSKEFGTTFPPVSAGPAVVQLPATPESRKEATENLRARIVQEFGGELGQ